MKSGGNVLSLTAKTDYYPFGMPMPNKHTTDGNYRYAFQGQEKDSETGMEAFELRLWDGRIGRWLTIDPYHEFFSPYLGMGNNPINLIDPDGGMTDPPKTGKVGEKYNDADYGMLTYDGNFWLDSNGEAILNGVTMVGVKSTGLSFFDDGSRSRLQLPGEYMRNIGDIDSVLTPEDWISQFTQPRPNVACKRTCDIIAGFSPLNNAINVASERNNEIVPTNNFRRGISTIDDYLHSGRPITVGVHHKFNAGYNEGTTDHYIVIVGRGTTNNQIYYRFYDVATRHRNLGTSPLNRLYLNGNSATGNTAYTNRRTYTLTQVRPN
jgi:RHS repeat-associated protein